MTEAIRRSRARSLDAASARATDPATSHAAAHLQHDGQRYRAMLAFENAAAVGLTHYELARAIGCDKGVASRRITDLRQLGLVVACDAERLSDAGRPSTVWRTATAVGPVMPRAVALPTAAARADTDELVRRLQRLAGCDVDISVRRRSHQGDPVVRVTVRGVGYEGTSLSTALARAYTAVHRTIGASA